MLPRTGDTALMLDDHSSLPLPADLHEWAGTLPILAAEVVSQSDISRPHVYTRYVAEPSQISVARAQITAWTQQLGFPSEHAQDVVLATDEAVSNAAEHAYRDEPGTLTLFAARVQQENAVRIIVSDHGHWRPPPANPGFRGRGLTMMERLTQTFRLVHSPHGTTVVLGWPIPG